MNAVENFERNKILSTIIFDNRTDQTTKYSTIDWVNYLNILEKPFERIRNPFKKGVFFIEKHKFYIILQP